MPTKAKRRRIRSNITASTTSKGNVLRDLGTNQIRQVTIQAALAIHLYTKKDSRFGELCTALFQNSGKPVTVINAGLYLQSVVDNWQHETSAPFAVISIATTFVTLLFLHALSVVRKQAKDRKVKIELSYASGNVIGLRVQRVTNAWKALCQNSGIDLLSEAVASHMLYNETNARFVLLTKRAHGFSPLTQNDTLRREGARTRDRTAWTLPHRTCQLRGMKQ